MKRIYFDHSSTTPVDNRVLDAMLPYFVEHFGNPSSILIEEGGRPHKAVEDAREKIARLIGAQMNEIIFTSSATESNNMAIKGLALANKDKGKHILFSDIEHFSIMNQADFMRNLGFEIDVNSKRMNALYSWLLLPFHWQCDHRLALDLPRVANAQRPIPCAYTTPPHGKHLIL